MTARVHQLLERHGIVTREAVQAEGVSGGFAAVYGVLKAMEDAGRVRRGYFVAGRGATQFALPGAVDRLRVVRESSDEPQRRHAGRHRSGEPVRRRAAVARARGGTATDARPPARSSCSSTASSPRGSHVTSALS